MKGKTIAILIVSHSLVIVAGILMARNSESGRVDTEAVNDGASGVVRMDRPGRPEQRREGFRAVGQWRGQEFARAWRAIRTAKLSTKDRVKTQRELLEKWAEVDLASAIEAAMEEEWDGDEGSYYNPTGPFLDVFSDEFAKDAAGSWELIQSGQFGVGAGMLRSVWFDSAARRDPVFSASVLGEVSWRDRDRLVNAVQSGVAERGDPELREEVFEILLRYSSEVVSVEQLASCAPQMDRSLDINALKDEVLRQFAEDPRLGEIGAVQLGERVAGMSSEEIAALARELPVELRGGVAWTALERTSWGSVELLGAADLLIESEAWDRVESRDMVQRLQSLEREGKEDQLAEWATTMPYRPETIELFHRSVDDYMRNNMGAAKDWIGGITDAGWRDRAYSEYSQVALNAHGDPGASRWALDQIQDQTFKAEAEGWRADWERRNPGK